MRRLDESKERLTTLVFVSRAPQADIARLKARMGRQEIWEDSPEGYPQTPTSKWWNWHDRYVADAPPDKKWVEVSDAGEAAFRNQHARTKP